MRCLGVIILVLLLASSGAGQDLSPLVLPSEDELLEALREGEIDYEQYLTLMELLAFGITSGQDDLIDEIPNLSLYQIGDTLDPLETEQAQAFAAGEDSAAGFRGSVAHRFGAETGGGKRSRYRTAIRVSPNEQWSFRGQIQREFAGRERVIERRVEYHADRGAVSKVVAGNFSQRFGLGVAMGRRGKLLDYDSRLDGESWLFPDNGGFNGVLAEGNAGSVAWLGMVSHQRDSAYSLSTAATMLSLARRRITPSIILNSTQLSNRRTSGRETDYSTGVNVEWKYRRGSIEVEAVGQESKRTSSVGAMAEGRHSDRWGKISYSAWIYGDGYADFTSGSRSARLSRDCMNPATGFAYTSRRSGQYGGIVKYVSEPVSGYPLTIGVAYGAFNRDTSLLQMSVGLTHPISKTLSVVVSSEERRQRRFQVGDADESIRRQTRVEARYANRHIRLRNYLAYGQQTDRHDFWSLFTSLRWTTHARGIVEAWSNFGCIEAGRLTYWYGFLRHEQEIVDHFSVGVKLAQSYRRGETPRRNTTIVLEATSRF